MAWYVLETSKQLMQDSAGRTGGVEEALLLACNGEGWDVMVLGVQYGCARRT